MEIYKNTKGYIIWLDHFDFTDTDIPAEKFIGYRFDMVIMPEEYRNTYKDTKLWEMIKPCTQIMGHNGSQYAFYNYNIELGINGTK